MRGMRGMRIWVGCLMGGRKLLVCGWVIDNVTLGSDGGMGGYWRNGESKVFGLNHVCLRAFWLRFNWMKQDPLPIFKSFTVMVEGPARARQGLMNETCSVKTSGCFCDARVVVKGACRPNPSPLPQTQTPTPPPPSQTQTPALKRKHPPS